MMSSFFWSQLHLNHRDEAQALLHTPLPRLCTLPCSTGPIDFPMVNDMLASDAVAVSFALLSYIMGPQ
jgi:hypothetical protein